MSDMNKPKLYAQKPAGTFFDDGRELELLHHVYVRADTEKLRGDPLRILKVMDELARQKFYMNVGPLKGKIVTDLISEVKPTTMVELGGYVGYSTLLFATAVRAAGGSQYYCLERNPTFGAVIMALAELAGLSKIIKVVIGPSDASLKRLHAEGEVSHIDLMFLDHYKPAYVPDLKLAEELKLVKQGSVLAADNVISPGNPPYLDYVRSSVQQKKEASKAIQDGTTNGIDSRFSKRSAEQYVKTEGQPSVDVTRIGNPNLIYESTLNESFEPTGEADGVEVTRCVGEEQ